MLSARPGEIGIAPEMLVAAEKRVRRPATRVGARCSIAPEAGTTVAPLLAIRAARSPSGVRHRRWVMPRNLGFPSDYFVSADPSMPVSVAAYTDAGYSPTDR